MTTKERFEIKIGDKREKHFDPKQLYHLLSNYHSILRDKQLNQLLNDY